MNMNPNDVDNRLLANDLDVAVEGTGVQAATQGKILSNPDQKKNADSASLANRSSKSSSRSIWSALVPE